MQRAATVSMQDVSRRSYLTDREAVCKFRGQSAHVAASARAQIASDARSAAQAAVDSAELNLKHPRRDAASRNFIVLQRYLIFLFKFLPNFPLHESLQVPNRQQFYQ